MLVCVRNLESVAYSSLKAANEKARCVFRLPITNPMDAVPPADVVYMHRWSIFSNGLVV